MAEQPMRVADYIVRTLADRGVRHVFMITGGGAMFLNQAFGSEPRIRYICNHHEQACAMAAESYARISGSIGVLNVTTGPGGINALNGVFGAWTDSVPMLIISGQVKSETCMASYRLPHLRQLGDQEADIVRMVHGITKYAVLVHDPQTIRYHLERAWFLAVSGRPGPCWLDIPVDVQARWIDPAGLAAYDPAEDQPCWDLEKLSRQCQDVIDRLQVSARPVLLAGSGVRQAQAVDLLHAAMRPLGIPVVPSWTAHDLIASDDALFGGRPGTLGDRAGNFTVQNSDTLLVIGSRLNVRQISYNWKTFARHAFKIQVDIDAAELNKPTVRPDLAIHADLRLFLEELCRQLDRRAYDPRRHADWLAWCKKRLAQYPVVSARQRDRRGALNPYVFMEELFGSLKNDDVVVCGDGSACVVSFQVAGIQQGQRLYTNSGCASMGYDLPAAVGAAVARGGRRVICLAGDGSIQLNIQELQTLAHHQLPVKIFVLNNAGYLSIRQTQLNFFGTLVGEGPNSGVTFPDMVKVAHAYGVPARRIEPADFPAALHTVLQSDGPFLAEVVLDPQQPFEPKLSSKQLPDGRIVSPPLEDMAPFLDRDELLANLLVPEMTH